MCIIEVGGVQHSKVWPDSKQRELRITRSHVQFLTEINVYRWFSFRMSKHCIIEIHLRVSKYNELSKFTKKPKGCQYTMCIHKKNIVT